MSKFDFLKETLQNLKAAGSKLISNNAIQKMIGPIDFLEADCIIQLEAGKGKLTETLLEEMKPTGKLLCFKSDEKDIQALRQLEDDRLEIIEDSPENMGEYLEDNGFMKANYIVSSLPLHDLPKELSDSLLKVIQERLERDGYYSQLQYKVKSGAIFEKHFNDVKMKLVIGTIPHFVFVCKNS